MEDFRDYTPTTACIEIEERYRIKVGKNILHKILRMKNIIDARQNVLDEAQYGRYFYFQWSEVAHDTYSFLDRSLKLFITEEGIDFLGEYLKDWLEEYKKLPK